MNLFQTGQFILHSGEHSTFKIEVAALTDADIETLARLIRQRVGYFRAVEGVPNGGLRLAAALAPYATYSLVDPLLLAGDVLTSGASMEEHRAGRDAIGIVIFARHPIAYPWITALFTMCDV